MRAGLCATPAEWRWSALEPGLGDYERKEDDADQAVHREERRVQSSQITWADKRMLVRQQRSDSRDTEPVPPTEAEMSRRHLGSAQSVSEYTSQPAARYGPPSSAPSGLGSTHETEKIIR